MNEHSTRIRQAIDKAQAPLKQLQSGKLDRKAALAHIQKLDGKKLALTAAGAAAAVSAVSLAAQYRFYQSVVSRELKRQLRPLHEQLDELRAENRQLRRELLKSEEAQEPPEA